MDLRFPLGLLGLSVALLMTGGCSPDDKNQQASLEERTAQFEQNLDTIKDSRLKMLWQISAARCCYWSAPGSSCSKKPD